MAKEEGFESGPEQELSRLQKYPICLTINNPNIFIISLEETRRNAQPNNPAPTHEGVDFTPLQILRLASEAVPAVKYAFGVAGIAAATSIVIIAVSSTKAGFLFLALTLVGMILLFLFSKLTLYEDRSTRWAATILLWSVLIFFIAFLVFTVTAFASQWPRPWSIFLGIS